jgi:hypothetical protein
MSESSSPKPFDWTNVALVHKGRVEIGEGVLREVVTLYSPCYVQNEVTMVKPLCDGYYVNSRAVLKQFGAGQGFLSCFRSDFLTHATFDGEPWVVIQECKKAGEVQRELLAVIIRRGGPRGRIGGK